MATKIEASLPPPPPPPKAPPRAPPPMPKNSKTPAAPSPPTLDNNGTIKSTGVKLKPLYWNKLILPRATQASSTVWDIISTDGSVNIDDDLMDALFPFKSTSVNRTISSSRRQISLLEPRKSQNIAIIIRSLNSTVLQVQDSLTNCSKGLSLDSLEKLSQISLTKEEQATILNFSGDVAKLAEAESFLYRLLKSVPSPFERVNAMLFMPIYSAEILHVRNCIKVLELACEEIKSNGLFTKLLEAVLKAGNRMNAATARGNARAFNLNVLCKLSDVKSTTDGNTTLLHFVVKEVMKSEGKLGLPVVGRGSEELRNVKEAASIDYDYFMSSCSDLDEIMKDLNVFLSSSKIDDGFVREMKGFLEASEAELTVMVEEQRRVMEIVKRTTEYYQPGSSKDKNVEPLQLFVIVADFFVMLDKVCVDIKRSMQKKTTTDIVK